jgi:hypothetical protein
MKSGQAFTTQERATDVFVKQNGRWQYVFSQLTFNNGQEILLQKLSDGLRMDVLSLALVEETPAPKPAARSSILEQVSVG